MSLKLLEQREGMNETLGVEEESVMLITNVIYNVAFRTVNSWDRISWRLSKLVHPHLYQ